LNKPLDQTIFTGNNLINEDKHIRQEISRFKNGRSEKKLKELHKEKGILYGREIQNIEDLMNETQERSFNFSIERKHYRDGFDNLFSNSKEKTINARKSK